MVDLTITHLKVDTVADGADTSLVRPSDWNANHVLTPLATPYAVIVGGTGSTSALQQVANLGSSGQVLTSAGTTALPTWTTVSSGTGTGSVTPAALTKTDDTNVTVTFTGSTTAALLQAVSMTMGWTGSLALNRGGLGLAAVAPYAVIAGGTTSTGAVQQVAAGTSGQFLAYVSATTLPTWQSVAATQIASGAALTKVDDANVTLALSGTTASALLRAVTITAGWTGTLPVERGGTTKGSFTSWALIAGGSGTTTALQSLASVGTSGQVLTSAGTTALPTWQAVGAGSDAAMAPQGRLTLTTGTAITTSDVTGATTLYYTPAIGFYIPITTDGTNFTNTVFTELSQAITDTTKSPAAVAASKIYDIYVWSDGGTVRATRGQPWTTDLSRGTGSTSSEVDFTTKFATNKFAITNGPAANRGVLVGSVRSDASSQLKDTFAFRWVSNIYNTGGRPMRVQDPATSWTYGTTTIRQANANTANQLDFLDSLGTQMVDVQIMSSGSHNAAGGVATQVGVGIDTTTAFSVGSLQGINQFALGTYGVQFTANWNGFPGIGRHTAVWCESGPSSGTTTFFGQNSTIQSGIQGSIQG